MSLLPKILAALLVALALGSVATVMLETRLARAALRAQARELLRSQLEVLRAGFVQRQTVVERGLRSAAQALALHDPDVPGHHADLVTKVGRVQRDLGLDALTVLTDRGETVVSLGVPMVAPPPDALSNLGRGAARLLLRTPDGDHVHAVVVPVGASPPRLLLIAGTSFGDATAYQLRDLVAHDVILVADDAVAGSTLSRPMTGPPGFHPAVPDAGSPAVIRLDGSETFVDYVPVAQASHPWEASGSVGLLVPEPVAALNRSLARNRLVSALMLALIALGVAWVIFRQITRPLQRLVTVARRIASGDLDAPFTAQTSDEVGELAEALERMRRAIRHNIEVINQQSLALRASSERIVNAQEEERRRLANDLHDGIQRELVMLRMRLASARRQFSRHPERLDDMWPELAGEVDALVESVRHTSHSIFPAVLQDQGLGAALHSLASRSPVTIRVHLQPDPLPSLARSVQASAYFLISEAVTNALKHSQAAKMIVTVRLKEGEQLLEVGVSDDGCGFDASAAESRELLVHLRDRVTALGGRLHIDSLPGRGSQVRALLPLEVHAVAASDGEGVPSFGTEPELVGDPLAVSLPNAAGRTAPPQPAGSNPSPR
ncbi:MAG: sensor histidine kinase [Actinomycetota bacterium]|nr:sensor histidine kinase [Actinomycetota bacterium]